MRDEEAGGKSEEKKKKKGEWTLGHVEWGSENGD